MALRKDEAAMSAIASHIEKNVLTVIDRRVATMNEPNELVEDMRTDYLSIDAVEELLEALMVKLGFRLPNRLIPPVTFFAACNYFAREINVNKDHFTIKFDPRNFGFIDEDVSKLLRNVEHPANDVGRSAYSLTIDQNMINAFIIQAGNIKKDFSWRKLLKQFDKKYQMMPLMSTSLFQLNMPQVVSQYGTRQFDIVTTIDQNRFMEANRKSSFSGFDVSNGKIKGTLNLVSFLKVAPRTLPIPKELTRKSTAEERKKFKEEAENFANSDDWVVARTIYTSLTIYGKVQLEKEDADTSVLKASIDGFDLAKMDFFKGDHTGAAKNGDDAPKDDQEDDEDEEEEDDDDDDTKTSEGALINAIINTHLKSAIRQFLPKFEHRFSNDLRRVDAFDCYGIHLQVPEIQHFDGGFAIVGNYKKVPVVNAACIQVETGLNDIITNQFTPKMLRQKLEIFIRLFEKLGSGNIEPKDIIAEVLKSSADLTQMKNIGGFDIDTIAKTGGEFTQKLMDTAGSVSKKHDVGLDDLMTVGNAVQEMIFDREKFNQKLIEEAAKKKAAQEAAEQARKEDL